MLTCCPAAVTAEQVYGRLEFSARCESPGIDPRACRSVPIRNATTGASGWDARRKCIRAEHGSAGSGASDAFRLRQLSNVLRTFRDCGGSLGLLGPRHSLNRGLTTGVICCAQKQLPFWTRIQGGRGSSPSGLSKVNFREAIFDDLAVVDLPVG
jgi:hypothetical protein